MLPPIMGMNIFVLNNLGGDSTEISIESPHSHKRLYDIFSEFNFLKSDPSSLENFN